MLRGGDEGEHGWGDFARVPKYNKRERREDLLSEGVTPPKKDHSPRAGGVSQCQNPPMV